MLIGPYVNGAAVIVGGLIGALAGHKFHYGLKPRFPSPLDFVL